jgi:hypothetical protein
MTDTVPRGIGGKSWNCGNAIVESAPTRAAKAAGLTYRTLSTIARSRHEAKALLLTDRQSCEMGGNLEIHETRETIGIPATVAIPETSETRGIRGIQETRGTPGTPGTPEIPETETLAIRPHGRPGRPTSSLAPRMTRRDTTLVTPSTHLRPPPRTLLILPCRTPNRPMIDTLRLSTRRHCLTLVKPRHTTLPIEAA